MYRSISRLVLCSTLLTLPGLAQVTWSMVPHPQSRHYAASAYDTVRKKLLVFGGDGGITRLADTWEWDGSTWSRVDTANVPGARGYQAMAYDAARDQIVMFGGWSGGNYGDTWVFDCKRRNWYQVFPGRNPSSRYASCMAYDAARGVVVLFGGSAGSQETWQWDGNDWRNVSLASSPPARAYATLANDVLRGKLVLFGGVSGSTYYNDTWEWDGAKWSLVSTSQLPPKRSNHSMVYDAVRGELVLMSGRDASTVLDDTWALRSGNWVSLGKGVGPRYAACAEFDAKRGQPVLFGGIDSLSWAVATQHSDTWAFNNGSWSLVRPGVPAARDGAMMVFDAKRSVFVLFGGRLAPTSNPQRFFDDTWQWNGTQWQQMSPAKSPPPRSHSAMVFDESTGKVLLFGGYNGNPMGDTWEFDGVAGTWTQFNVQAPNAPSPRYAHCLAYDAKSRRCVLFGGFTGASNNETWEWDGTAKQWQLLSPSTKPSARYYAAMASDGSRLVLFGGYSGLADTWSWDSTARTWTQLSSALSPSGRYAHSMVFDGTTNSLLMFGGYTGTAVNDVWQLNGSSWTKCVQLESPDARYYFALAADSERGRTVLFGGYPHFGDTWELYNRTPPTWRAFGQACPSSPLPTIAPMSGSVPAIGRTFTVGLSNLPVASFPFIVLGTSDKLWGAIPLPLNLGFLGKPQCYLHVSMDFLFLVPSASLPLPIPADHQLIGQSFFLQGLAYGTTPVVGMTNGGEAKIGTVK